MLVGDDEYQLRTEDFLTSLLQFSEYSVSCYIIIPKAKKAMSDA